MYGQGRELMPTKTQGERQDQACRKLHRGRESPPGQHYLGAEWCIRGDVVQVDLSEAMNYGANRYAGLLQDITLANDASSGLYVSACTLRTMLKRDNTAVRFVWFSLYLIMDQDTSITYLATPVYNHPTTLDVPDHKVQVEQTDNPNYLAYKIMGDGSTVSVEVVRENGLGQAIDPFLRIKIGRAHV